jgi:hypothetical protein
LAKPAARRAVGLAMCCDVNGDLSNNRNCISRRMKQPHRASRAAFSWGAGFVLLHKKMPPIVYFLPCGKAPFWL